MIGHLSEDGIAEASGTGLLRACTRLTVVLIAAWVGTRMARSWWVPSRRASSTLASTLRSGRSMQAARIGVVGAAAAQGARGELGGERRVAGVELAVLDQRREDQVGVGVVHPDRLQHVVGGQPRQVDLDARAGAAGAGAGVSHRRDAA